METPRAGRQTSPDESKAVRLGPQVDLIYQALETELAGVEVYSAALACVQNGDLREEWQKYRSQTEEHVKIARALCEKLGLDPHLETPGRQVVRFIGKSLVEAIRMAAASAGPEAAEIVAAECIMLAETKDHANWSLIGKLSDYSSTQEQPALQDAYEEVEDQEDEHLYHTSGWARELWLAALELPTQLPPPEEIEDVRTEEEAVEVKKRSAAERG